MGLSKGYLLLTVAVLTLMMNIVVAHIALLFHPGGTHHLALVLSLALCSAMTFMLIWTLTQRARHNARLLDEMRRLVHRDQLSGAATRDYLFEHLASKPDHGGALLMLDIDFFKQVNDTYGHLAGDEVIRSVAQTLQSNLRASDIVCRFGGEEFAVFMPGATEEQAMVAAERLRTTVAEMTARFEDTLLRVTVSVGVALKTPGAPIEAALKAADDALYLAKRGGRDRVELAWRKRESARTVSTARLVLVASGGDRLPNGV